MPAGTYCRHLLPASGAVLTDPLLFGVVQNQPKVRGDTRHPTDARPIKHSFHTICARRDISSTTIDSSLLTIAVTSLNLLFVPETSPHDQAP